MTIKCIRRNYQIAIRYETVTFIRISCSAFGKLSKLYIIEQLFDNHNVNGKSLMCGFCLIKSFSYKKS